MTKPFTFPIGASDGKPLSMDLLKLVERFRVKINYNGPVPENRPELGPCWLWTGKLDKHGYGLFSVKKHWRPAHRWFYEQVRGPISRSLDVDHLCRTHDCVNPDHLEPTTRRVNLLRGNTIPARHAAKTHCPKGHEYSPANTYLYRGSRQCVICRHERDLARHATHRL